MTRILTILRKIAMDANSAPRTTSTDESGDEAFTQATVQALYGDGRVMVSIGGKTTHFAVPTTDEPFHVGDIVWVSETSVGWIVHGGAR
jgi:hypothetical protein